MEDDDERGRPRPAITQAAIVEAKPARRHDEASRKARVISAFDLFKIGVGPSSSHTVGPMVAAARFRDQLGQDTSQIQVEIFGSLAWTGRGHGTDIAICLGLLGHAPATIDPDAVLGLMGGLRETQRIPLADSGHEAAFDPCRD